MSLRHLQISNLRNIGHCSLDFGPQLNIIAGANGSGKTSVLEAIYLLGRGKSFRSAYSRRIVRHGQSSLIVFGRVSNDLTGQHGVGIQINDGKFTSKVDGQYLTQSSGLASLVPLLLINPDADKLVKGSPRLRRGFLDWGLFHVEQTFLSIWHRYSRVLKQRNAQLKRGMDSIFQWNQQFLVSAAELHALRVRYVHELTLVAEPLFNELVGFECTFSYHQGWPDGLPIEEATEDNIASDIRAGFTQRGPHRADLVMFVDGRRASDVLSGGQLKLAACALIIAQARMFVNKFDRPCLLLIDDLPAELDVNRRKILMGLLEGSGCQLFVTTTDPRLLDFSGYGDARMFHVEQGVVAAR